MTTLLSTLREKVQKRKNVFPTYWCANHQTWHDFFCPESSSALNRLLPPEKEVMLLNTVRLSHLDMSALITWGTTFIPGKDAALGAKADSDVDFSFGRMILIEEDRLPI